MVCDKAYCNECGDNENMLMPSICLGWPFVHSSDTVKGAKKATVFQPVKHGSLEITVSGYERYVRSETEEGLKTIRAQVCGYVGCRMCEAVSQRR